MRAVVRIPSVCGRGSPLVAVHNAVVQLGSDEAGGDRRGDVKQPELLHGYSYLVGFFEASRGKNSGRTARRITAAPANPIPMTMIGHGSSWGLVWLASTTAPAVKKIAASKVMRSALNIGTSSVPSPG